MSFGGDYGKDTGTYMPVVKGDIDTMVVVIPEITIKDETNEFDDRELKQEYKKIYRDEEECATILTKEVNELPVYIIVIISKKK